MCGCADTVSGEPSNDTKCATGAKGMDGARQTDCFACGLVVDCTGEAKYVQCIVAAEHGDGALVHRFGQPEHFRRGNGFSEDWRVSGLSPP